MIRTLTIASLLCGILGTVPSAYAIPNSAAVNFSQGQQTNLGFVSNANDPAIGANYPVSEGVSPGNGGGLFVGENLPGLLSPVPLSVSNFQEFSFRYRTADPKQPPAGVDNILLIVVQTSDGWLHNTRVNKARAGGNPRTDPSTGIVYYQWTSPGPLEGTNGQPLWNGAFQNTAPGLNVNAGAICYFGDTSTGICRLGSSSANFRGINAQNQPTNTNFNAVLTSVETDAKAFFQP